MATQKIVLRLNRKLAPEGKVISKMVDGEYRLLNTRTGEATILREQDLKKMAGSLATR